MIMLSEYLQADPELYSICLDNNPFTDDSLTVLANALRKNKKVAHLSIQNCPNITDVGLKELYDIIMDHNMVLFQLDIDIEKFDEEIAQELVRMSALNRDIQQKLRPRFELRKVDQ
jgi:Ran GTPase-activating protein (RanGAP) involved in mRNA processing and transport